MKVVIVCEKPSQARNIGNTLGIEGKHENYLEIKKSELLPYGAILVWTVGHLVSLKMPQEYDPKYETWNLEDLPIKPAKYEYKIENSTRDLFQTIKYQLAEADTIINATDAGIEGTHIFFSILETANINIANKTLKRLWISSEEKSEVLQGFRNLEPIEKDLLRFERGKTRAISDWYLGINASRYATLKVKEKTPNAPKIAIGRNMQVVLSMVYQRQNEIANFVSKPFYELDANFFSEQGEYKGKSKLKFDTKEDFNKFIAENNLVLSENLGAKVSEVTKVIKSQYAPTLLSLSSLQKLAFKKFKYSPEKTLKIAQTLYEKRVLSYPRTDSKYISENEYEYLKDLVGDLKNLLNIDFEPIFKPIKKHVDASKVTDHYALLPTRKIANVAELSAEERNIYLEVIKSATALFMPTYQYEETKIITTIHDIPFYTTGRIEKVRGWKEILDEADTKDTILPNVFEEQEVQSVLIENEGCTQPPKAYNEGDMIELMEYAGRTLDDEAFSEEREILSEIKGIGTAATRSGTIEKLFSNGYLDLTDKKIVYVTAVGSSICKLVEGTSLVSPVITAEWEKSLKDIENGILKGEEFIMTIEKEVTEINGKITENLETTEFKAKDADAPTCPKCKKGKVINKGKVFGCTQYNETGCDFSIFTMVAKKALTDQQVLDLIKKGQTGVIKGFKSKTDKDFAAILKLNAEWDLEFIFPDLPACPKCKKGNVVDKGKLVGCSQYNETGCDFSIFKNIAGKTLSDKQILDLIEKGETALIKGFKSKTDKEFAAILKLKTDGTIELVFPQNATCPKCKKGEVVDKGKLIGCTHYAKTGCSFSIFKVICEKELTEKHLTDLVTKGKTGKIKGFVSKKSRKEFEAKLILNKDFQVEFDFS
ncbi:type IA DNA topoisomerase [Metasolibacillus sp.]|uniref:type IA DNA topoisomerase n=1 Tax=Metasolibacillus sp. TaxID=2703680 RepID=UPI0025E9763C|nr:type IA DNA topoisomerase [Metasolibacillus sp.]MCT6922833.1 DNA topoisomerase [Metasolibacillus sp.]MCT6938828.1 DNA topoisomerase [Metasolibacillus sp.]